MSGAQPMHYFWWLSSRASGVVALVLVAVSVTIGLTMSTRIARRHTRWLVAVHEHTALAGLIAIAVHGLTLLGDTYIRPGISGIAVPFAISYRPAAVAVGIVAAWLAALLGLSFYFKRRLPPGLWRKAHRATALVWALGLVHSLTAGTDAGSPLLQGFMIATGAPILVLLALRLRGRAAPSTRAGADRLRPG